MIPALLLLLALPGPPSSPRIITYAVADLSEHQAERLHGRRALS